MSGYIKTYRKIMDWEWYTDSNVMRVFIHCLLKANYTEKKWRGIEIDRGSFITSYSKLGTELNLTIQQIRTALDKLKSTNEITIKTTSKYSIISINSYDDYQENNTQDNTQITIKQQTNNKQITTTKKEREIKKEKNINKDIVEDTSPVVKETINSIIKSIENEELREALFDFKEHRTSIKSKLTIRALKLLLSQLDKLTNDDNTKVEILKQSILNGWKGVFPLKQNNGYKPKHEAQSPKWVDQHEQYRKTAKPKEENVSFEDTKKLLESMVEK